MSRILLSIAAVCVLLFPASGAMAAPAPDSGTAKVQAPQDKPAKTDSRVTVVSVTLDGSDSVGARLGMKLKEAFNSSNLFSLSEADSPKLRILVDTKSEFQFPSRPGVGSVYSVTWVFSQGEGYLPFLLSKEIGTLTMDEVDGLVARLVERTDGLSVKYGNLWKK